MMHWFRRSSSFLCSASMLTCCLLLFPTVVGATETSTMTDETPQTDRSPAGQGASKSEASDETDSEPRADAVDTSPVDTNAVPAKAPTTGENTENLAPAAVTPTPTRATSNTDVDSAPEVEEAEEVSVEGELAEARVELESPAGGKAQIAERRILAYASTAVAVLAFGAGGTIGYLARDQYDCLQNVLACNENLATPIEGTEYLDQVAEMEQKAVLADMMLVLGVASSVVAITNWVQGFLWTAEEQKDARAFEHDAPRYAAQRSEGAHP